MVWELNPGGGEICVHPDQPDAHPASCTMGTESLPKLKQPGLGADLPPPSNTEVLNAHLSACIGMPWGELCRTSSGIC